MNALYGAVARIASRNGVISRPNTLIGQFYLSTIATSEKAAKFSRPRPSEIPFQVKVANLVNMTGYVDMPIQFKSSSDGKYWAATIINQIPCSHSPPLWIPVIFEGDLAHVAACHLKQKDHVHIAGQLIADSPMQDASKSNTNVQVLVHSLNFVELYSQTTKSSASQNQKEAVNQSASMKKDRDSVVSAWLNLLDNPKEWWDCRCKKKSGSVSPRHPDFKRKDGTSALWLGDSVPTTILSKIAEVEFDVQTDKSKYPKQRKGEELWKELAENPNKWWDNRTDKRNVRAPDFKHKETGEVLWLNDLPDWVLSKLPSPYPEKKAVPGKTMAGSSFVSD